MTDEQPPEDLGHAGAVVDKAIEHMLGQNIAELSIASALLGGAMAVLARSVADDAIVQILAMRSIAFAAANCGKWTSRDILPSVRGGKSNGQAAG